MWRSYADWKDPVLRLHIGGQQKMPHWKVLDPEPGPDVDYVGDCLDLSRFADGSVDELYAANLLEDPAVRVVLPQVLKNFHRMSKAGGTVRISVPDADVLGALLADPEHTGQDREDLEKVAYPGGVREGGLAALSFEALRALLREAGFATIERVRDFGLFHDQSRRRFHGAPLALNVVARK
jgi:predicted SAM-dependent methyltransferase